MLRVDWDLSRFVFCTVEKETLVRDHWVLDMYWVPFIIKDASVCKNCCWGTGFFSFSVCLYFIMRKWFWGKRLETVCRRLKPRELKFPPCKICCYCFCTSSDIYFSKIPFYFLSFPCSPSHSFEVLQNSTQTLSRHWNAFGALILPKDLWYDGRHEGEI